MKNLKSFFSVCGLYNKAVILSKYLIITFIAITLIACKKNNPVELSESTFKLTSSDIQPDSLLPKEYTCDGESSTLPLEWSGFPENTKSFALIMHHEASPTNIHWYWVLYDIPSSVHSLSKNESGIGTLGNNSVNGKTEYAPPCSQGPGPKKYIYTIYALSESVDITVPDSEVSREVLLDSIKNITLASTNLTVIYSREN